MPSFVVQRLCHCCKLVSQLVFEDAVVVSAVFVDVVVFVFALIVSLKTSVLCR